MDFNIFSQIFGIVGVCLALFSGFLIYRKRLLNSGFDAFRNSYRIEMDDFKKNILAMVNTFREMSNKNDERHTRTFQRVVELYESTNQAVKSQSNVCELLQVKKEGDLKLEKVWKTKIMKELDQVQSDVRHIKEVLNHDTR